MEKKAQKQDITDRYKCQECNDDLRYSGQILKCINCGTEVQNNAQQAGHYNPSTGQLGQVQMFSDKNGPLTQREVSKKYGIKVQFNNLDNSSMLAERENTKVAVSQLNRGRNSDLNADVVDMVIFLGTTLTKKNLKENIGFIIYYLRRERGNNNKNLILDIANDLQVTHRNIVSQAQKFRPRFTPDFGRLLFDADFRTHTIKEVENYENSM